MVKSLSSKSKVKRERILEGFDPLLVAIAGATEPCSERGFRDVSRVSLISRCLTMSDSFYFCPEHELPDSRA